MKKFFMVDKTINHVYVGLAGLFCLLAFFWIKSFSHPIHDFANYYYSSLSIVKGSIQDLYDPLQFNLFVRSTGATDIFVNYSPHPPFSKWVFFPFLFFDTLTAKLIFSLSGIFLFIHSLIKLNLHLKGSKYLYYLLPLIFFMPLQNNILFGQTYLWLFFFLTECFLASEKNRFWLSSFWLSLAILIKLTPLFLILYFISKKQYRIVIYSLVFVVIYIGIDVTFSGTEQWVIFISEIIWRSSEGLVNVTMSPHFQSFSTLTKYLFLQDVNYNSSPLIASDSIMYFLNYFVSGFLVVSAFLIGKKSTSFQAFAFFVAILMFITPIGSTYSQILYVFLFLAICHSIQNKIGLVAVGILFFLSANVLYSFGPDLFYLNFIRLFLLLFILSYFIFKYRSRDLIYALSIAIFMGVSAFFIKDFPVVTGKADLEENNTIVASEISIVDDKIILHYLNGSGISEKYLKRETAVRSHKFLNLPEDDLMNALLINFNKSENIKQAVMVNEKDLYFLSDSRHGYHFYQLRKISL